jgi:hypothetical protein
MRSPMAKASQVTTTERAPSRTARATSGVGHPTASPTPVTPASVVSSINTLEIPEHRPYAHISSRSKGTETGGLESLDPHPRSGVGNGLTASQLDVPKRSGSEPDARSERLASVRSPWVGRCAYHLAVHLG